MKRYSEISQFRRNRFDLVTNLIYYPIASFLCMLLSYTQITPNFITWVAILLELIAVYLIVIDLAHYKMVILLLLQFGWIFDLMDGMMARYKKMGSYDLEKPSNKGYYLDAVSDHILKFMIILQFFLLFGCKILCAYS